MPIPSCLSKPPLLGAIAAAILLALLLGIKLLPTGPEDEKPGGPVTGTPPPIPGSSGEILPRNSSRKSSIQRSGAKDLESNQAAKALSRKETMIAVSVRARTDLKKLRETLRDEFDSPEAREEFAETIRNIQDPAERKKLMEERATSMRIARDRADAERGFPGRSREKRLIALMQVQNLWRMNSQVSRNRSLKVESTQFDEQLADWVEKAEGMSDEEFHRVFNDLRHRLNELRIRNEASSTGQP